MGRAKTTNITTEAAIRELVAQGKKFPEIAQELGVNLSSLRNTCCMLGIKSPKRALATAKDFHEAMQRGESPAEIATRVGISRQHVYFTLKRAGLPTTPLAVLREQIAQRA